jgi:HNH endonuclease/AP2 domain
MNIADFKHLNYNPDTGLFFSNTNIEMPIGTRNKHGYVVFKVNGKLFYAHRIAFFLIHGFVPKIVDHINRNKSDNRIKNLREVTARLNSQNTVAQGITKPKHTKKWVAAITCNRKRIHLGYFDSAEQAHKAYILAKQKYHPNARLELEIS